MTTPEIVTTDRETREKSMAPSAYTIDIIRDEARSLVEHGTLSRQQPIYTLCQYIPGREWICVEVELEKNDFLLRDRIIDLIGNEQWKDD